MEELLYLKNRQIKIKIQKIQLIFHILQNSKVMKHNLINLNRFKFNKKLIESNG